jgi:hypothetical protein
VFTSVVIILLVLVFLFSGASITARASQSALPGEPLYAIKTSLEQTQLRFSVGISQQVGLYLSFASNRLNEMDGLIQIGRYSDAILVSDEFCSYLAKAFTAVDQLEQLDPVQAARLSSELSVRISAFSTRLGQMASKLPDVFQTRLLADIPFPVESVVVQHTGNGTQPQDLSDDDQNLRGRAGNMVDGDQGLTASTPAADESTLQQDWGAGLTQDEDNRIKQHGPAPSQDEAVSNEIAPDGH